MLSLDEKERSQDAVAWCSVNVWPMISGATKASPRANTPLPIGHNCLVQGDWKIITTSTSPDFWQGLSYPNSTSEKLTHEEELARREGLRVGEGLPPRPYPRMLPCGSGAVNQSWVSATPSQPAPICSADAAMANLCWNVQGGHATDRLILYGRSTQKNSLFSLKGTGAKARLWSPLLPPEGCVG